MPELYDHMVDLNILRVSDMVCKRCKREFKRIGYVKLSPVTGGDTYIQLCDDCIKLVKLWVI